MQYHCPRSNLKISPLAMILHKSRKYRAILDLSFVLKVAGWDLPSVNEATKEIAPAETPQQVGTVMPASLRHWRQLPYLRTQSTAHIILKNLSLISNLLQWIGSSDRGAVANASMMIHRSAHNRSVRDRSA